MFLCDNGARVIHIVPPGESGRSGQSGNRVWDRGKESIHLDLDAPADLDAFYRLVSGADVVVDTLAPSSPRQSTTGYTKLASLNPRLVYCSITAYGTTGPLKDEAAHEDLAAARTGILSLVPSFRPGPPHMAIPVVGIGTALLAAQGIVAALFDRERTGRGRKVETSLMAGSVTMSPKASNYTFPPNLGPRRATGSTPFYSVIRCADGIWLQLSCIHEKFTEAAADVFGVTERISDPRFGDWRNIPGWLPAQKARDELYEILADAISTKTYQEWSELLEPADVPHGRVNTVPEAMEDPQVIYNDMVIDVEDQEVGTVSQMGLPIKLLGTPGHVKGGAPSSGQDTDKVLADLADKSHREPDEITEPAGRSDLPLAGVKILEAANIIAGPMAVRYLVDLGAEVIKLEPPHGDITRPTGRRVFFSYNTGKRGISIDARTDQGREIVRRLGQEADAIVENMRPGAASRIGLDFDDLTRDNPGLVFTHISAYGSGGPYARRPGLDPVAEALSGLMWTQGNGEIPVQLDVLALVDYTASLLGALGTVLALFARERMGKGQEVETNLLSAAVLLVSEHFTRYPGKPDSRMIGSDQYGSSVAHRLYETGDGWLYIAADQPQQWAALTETVLDGESLPVAGSNDAAPLLEKAFGSRTTEEWAQLLRSSGVPVAPVDDEFDSRFYTNPQVLANDMVVQVQHPVLGDMKVSRNLVRFPDARLPAVRPTPLLGEHTQEILCELGFSAEQTDQFYQRGIAKTEEVPAGSDC